MKTKYAIVGCTVAGIHAAKTIRQQDPEADIFVVSFEINPLGYYDREDMPQHLIRGASNPDDGLIDDEKALAAQGIQVEYDLMEAIFPRTNQLLLNHGIRKAYDKLLVATEATPMLHDAPGINWLGVHQLRIYEDITWIENWIDALQEHGAVIISYGIHNLDNDGKLGLEMCYALKQRGVDVTYITSAAHVGAPFLDPALSEKITQRLQTDGIRVITDQTVTAYNSEDTAILDAVELSDGRVIPTRMALSTIGVRPTLDVIEDQGFDIDENTETMIVNERMQTNLPNVYAAGSAASVNGYVAHTSEQAAEQGRVAALNMLGQEASYRVFNGALDTTLYDLPFAYFGTSTPMAETWTWNQGDDTVARVYLEDGRVQGAQLLGRAVEIADQILALYESGETTGAEQLEQMFAPA